MLIRAEIVQDFSPSRVTGHAGVCGKQGWMDRQHVLSLALLSLTGAEHVEDRGHVPLFDIERLLC